MIDDLVSNSDVLVGIYADTIGSPEPFLCGLRPVEYEFVRFIIQSQCRIDSQKYRGGVDSVLPPPEERGGAYVEPPESIELPRILAAIGHDLADLKHLNELRRRANFRDDLEPIYERMMADKASTVAVFQKRIRLFRKNFSSDKPVSSHLLRNLATKPHATYQSRREEEADGSRPVYFPATADLYRQVYDELTALKDGHIIPPATECAAAIVANTMPQPGYLRRALREVYHAGFNVDRVAIGKDTKQASKPRSIVLALSSYHGSISAEAIQLRLQDLRASIINGFVKQEVRMPEVSCTPASESENTGRMDSIEKHDDHMPERRIRIRLTANVADVPGMLFRVVERIDAHGGNIFMADVREPHYTIASDPQPTRVLPGSRRELVLHAEVAGLGRGEGDRAQTLVHHICAELRFLVGVYDVRGEIL